jgi:hypothetical protein
LGVKGTILGDQTFGVEEKPEKTILLLLLFVSLSQVPDGVESLRTNVNGIRDGERIVCWLKDNVPYLSVRSSIVIINTSRHNDLSFLYFSLAHIKKCQVLI